MCEPRATALVVCTAMLLSTPLWAADVAGDGNANPVIVPEGFQKIRPSIADITDIPQWFCSGFLHGLQDGRLLNVYHQDGNLQVAYSADAGNTWTRPQVIEAPNAKVNFGRPSALQTRDGVIWLFTYGLVKWSPDPDEAKSDIWIVRSTDNGKTWDQPQLVWHTYTGMTQGAIETSSGHILFPFCYLGPPAPRFETVRFLGGCLVSNDKGQSWQCAKGLEVPPEADAKMRRRINGGTLEPSVVQLKDGRVWMVMRTVTGYLWESYSRDGGLTWTEPEQTSISCGGPVYLTRLPSSGLLAMVWNEADWTQAERWSGWPNGYARASVAVSDDDGNTWYKPVLFARGGKRTVHSMVVECAPDKILLNMMERQVFLRTTVDRLVQPGDRN